MAAGVMTVDIHLPENTSLKGKRQVLQSLKMGLRNRFNVSVAETGYQDMWQRAELEIAAVAFERVVLEGTFEKIFKFIEVRDGLDLFNSRVEYL